MTTYRRIAALLVALAVVHPTAAAAQGPEDRKANALAEEGFEALKRKDFTTAADRLKTADGLRHNAATLLGLARAQVGLGKLSAAHGTYQRVLGEEPPRSEKLVEEARRELDALAPRLAWLTIEVKGSRGAKVTLDDADVSVDALGQLQAIDPGRHVVKVTGEGLDASETFIVSAGEERVVKLTVKRTEADPEPTPAPAQEPAPAPPPAPPEVSSTQKTLGIVALVIGGAGITAGAVLGIVAANKQSNLSNRCTDKECMPPSHKTLDEYRTIGAASTVAFIAGGAGLGLGIVLLATAPSAPKEEHAKREIRPFIGLGSVGAVGRF